EGRVVVRREVQVVRQGEVEAALVAEADVRKQEAADAPVVEREPRVGQPEHWHVEHAEGHVARAADALGAVEFYLARGEGPLLAADIAGREGRLGQARMVDVGGDRDRGDAIAAR